MQQDEVIWKTIRHNYYSFMAKIPSGIFCRNPYNVTGICNRRSCPLANSCYTTIREEDGVLYLYMKTIERAHMPNKLWERVKLPKNYEKTLGIIDKHLMYWPKLLVHKTKQRLTKMTQMRIRMRKLALKTREKIISTAREDKKREARREEKAEKAALLEKSIEKELIPRLVNQTYPGRRVDDIFNYLPEKFDELLQEHQLDDEEVDEEPEVEYVESYDEFEQEDDIEDFHGLAFGHSQDEENVEANEEVDNGKRMRNETAWAAKRIESEEGAAKPKRARVLVQLEHEGADERHCMIH